MNYWLNGLKDKTILSIYLFNDTLISINCYVDTSASGQSMTKHASGLCLCNLATAAPSMIKEITKE